ncbi:MAG: hypothetical protein ACI9F9_000315, partial [Candidatus Paceibacteria bacterium]
MFLCAVLAACGSQDGVTPGEADQGVPEADGGTPPVARKPLALPGSGLSLRARRERTVNGKPEWMLAAELSGDGQESVIAATNSPGALLIWRNQASQTETVPCGDFPLRPVALAVAGDNAHCIALVSREKQDVTFLDLSRSGNPQVVSTHVLKGLPMVTAAGRLDAGEAQELLVITRAGVLERGTADGPWVSQELGGSMPRCALLLGSGSALVVGYQASDSLELYKLSDDGSFAAQSSHPMLGTARDLLAIDVDSDGDDELIVVEGDHGGWIFGVGESALFDGQEEPIAFRTTAIPFRLASLAQGNQSSWTLLGVNSLALEIWDWKSQGPVRRMFTYAGQTPVDFVLSDSDGDGRQDFWVANRDAHRVSIMRMSENGPIEPLMATVGAFPNDIAVGDLDRDGLSEAFVVNAKDEDISVLIRDGNAGLRTHVRVPTGPSPRAVCTGDLNQDGTLDLLWLERGVQGTQVGVRLGDGALGLSLPEGFQPFGLGLGCRDLILENFPGEARAVLVATDEDGRKLIWTRAVAAGAGIQLEEPQALSLPGLPRALATLRFEGEARAVVVAVQLSVEQSVVQLYTPSIAPDQSLTWQLQAQQELPGAVIDIATGDM